MKRPRWGRIATAALVAVAVFPIGRAVLELPPVGRYPGPYGDSINVAAPRERRTPEAVTAVVFDYRGLDTLGEEFILFTTVLAVGVLLRSLSRDDEDVLPDGRKEPFGDEPMEVLFAFGRPAIALLFAFRCYTIFHGHLSPGGGFQGGVIVGNAMLTVYLCGRFAAFRKVSPHPPLAVLESLGAAGYALLGLSMMLAGGAFLQNLLPLGSMGGLFSAGTIPVLNFCSGLEVAAAFTLLFREFLGETRRNGGAAK